MLRASLRKIRSAPKARAFTFLAGGTAVLLIVWAVVLASGLRSDKPRADVLLQTKNQTYRLELADTQEERSRGLGGRKSMPRDTGMLFVFDNEDSYCFWMKDTLIPLDMIWADASKKISHIQPGVQPASYPEQFCANGRYVVELNAGEAARNGLEEGRKLDF